MAFSRELIRNFCIIAHIDHGKSTLADRMMAGPSMVLSFWDSWALWVKRTRPSGVALKSSIVNSGVRR